MCQAVREPAVFLLEVSQTLALKLGPLPNRDPEPLDNVRGTSDTFAYQDRDNSVPRLWLMAGTLSATHVGVQVDSCSSYPGFATPKSYFCEW